MSKRSAGGSCQKLPVLKDGRLINARTSGLESHRFVWCLALATVRCQTVGQMFDGIGIGGVLVAVIHQHKRLFNQGRKLAGMIGVLIGGICGTNLVQHHRCNSQLTAVQSFERQQGMISDTALFHPTFFSCIAFSSSYSMPFSKRSRVSTASCASRTKTDARAGRPRDDLRPQGETGQSDHRGGGRAGCPTSA